MLFISARHQPKNCARQLMAGSKKIAGSTLVCAELTYSPSLSLPRWTQCKHKFTCAIHKRIDDVAKHVPLALPVTPVIHR